MQHRPGYARIRPGKVLQLPLRSIINASIASLGPSGAEDAQTAAEQCLLRLWTLVQQLVHLR